MRLCLVSGEFPPLQGGVGDYTHELSRALVAKGAEVHVVTSLAEGVGGSGQAANVVAPFEGYAVHRVTRRWNWGCWRKIRAVQMGAAANIVHVQYQAAAYGMHPAINLLPLRWRLSGPRRPRVVTTFHDLRVPYLFPKAGRLRWDLVLGLARWSDAVIVTNASDQERLAASSVEASLVPIGSNIEPLLPASFERDRQRESWGIDRDAFVICHFGFMNARKGVDTLLQAVRLWLAESGGANKAHLLMIGGKTGSSDPTNLAYLGKIETLIDRLHLGDRVTWTGFLPPQGVSSAFAIADCCVLPYREGASFRHGTLMAALAHGLPIVTTVSSERDGEHATPDLRDGEDVLLVPSDEPKALAAALARLAATPELLTKLGRSARESSKRFSWEVIAEQHLEVYCGLA